MAILLARTKSPLIQGWVWVVDPLVQKGHSGALTARAIFSQNFKLPDLEFGSGQKRWANVKIKPNVFKRV